MEVSAQQQLENRGVEALDQQSTRDSVKCSNRRPGARCKYGSAPGRWVHQKGMAPQWRLLDATCPLRQLVPTVARSPGPGKPATT